MSRAAYAQANQIDPGPPAERSTEFTAVEGAPEQYSGTTLLVAAYVSIWALLMVWILLLWRKQATLSARLAGLESAIDRALAARDEAARR